VNRAWSAGGHNGHTESIAAILHQVLTVIVQESGNNRGNTAEMIASELMASSLSGFGKEV